MWRSGSLSEIYWAVVNCCCSQLQPSWQFQYSMPSSLLDLETAGHLKQMSIDFQEHLKFQTSLWNSQSPRSSTTQNWRLFQVIGSPALSKCFALSNWPPGPCVGLNPSKRMLQDQVIHLKMQLSVLFARTNPSSQDHIRKRLYRTLLGRQHGIFNHKHRIFSFL